LASRLDAQVVGPNLIWYPTGLVFSQRMSLEPSPFWASHISATVASSESYSVFEPRRFSISWAQNGLAWKQNSYRLEYATNLKWSLRKALGTSRAALPTRSQNIPSPFGENFETVELKPTLKLVSVQATGSEFEIDLYSQFQSQLNKRTQPFGKKQSSVFLPSQFGVAYTHWLSQDIGNAHKSFGRGELFGDELQ
jgi:hypothetical protein